MTETEWFSCTNLKEMLEALHEPSTRKVWLYAIACCRNLWPDMIHEPGRIAIEVAERHVHGQATDDELVTARSNANDCFRKTCTYGASTGHQLTRAAVAACRSDGGGIIRTHLLSFETRRGREQNFPFLRDIFPFKPLAIDPAWLTDTVLALARGIYEAAAFDRLPILADALMDSGCEDRGILDHCRSAGPHVRGCQVIDALLGMG